MDKERIIQDELNSITFSSNRYRGQTETNGLSKRFGIEITLSLYDSIEENETTIKDSIEFMLNRLLSNS